MYDVAYDVDYLTEKACISGQLLYFWLNRIHYDLMFILLFNVAWRASFLRQIWSDNLWKMKSDGIIHETWNLIGLYNEL